jgi:hypothetical protein
MLTDLMENAWRKILWGFGDSMGKQLAQAANQMQPGVTPHGFSAGSSIVGFAALRGRFSGVASIDLPAAPIDYGIARWAAATAGASLSYRTVYFDAISVVAPSLNPLKFLSGFLGYRHSMTTYYP